MGKGDKKTRRGKIFAGSFGNVRRPDTNTGKKSETATSSKKTASKAKKK